MYLKKEESELSPEKTDTRIFWKGWSLDVSEPREAKALNFSDSIFLQMSCPTFSETFSPAPLTLVSQDHRVPVSSHG